MFVTRGLARSMRVCAATRTHARPLLSHTMFRSYTEKSQPENSKNTTTEQPKTSEQTENVEMNSSAGFAPFFYGLMALGVGLVSYGLYETYAMMTLWPIEVRQDLRSGLRAKRKGNWDTAIQHLSRAWDTAQAVPRETFGDLILLKVSGIGIALAGALEENGQTQRAYDTYRDVLWYLRTAFLGSEIAQLKDADLGAETLKQLTSAEKMRTIALAYKLGELANELGKPEKEEEKWLVWSVEKLLFTVLDATPSGKVDARNAKNAQNGPDVRALVDDLELPTWCWGYNLAAPFEALASLYSRQGNAFYALPLYLQAISILLPPPPATSSYEDRCRGSQLMGNVAELILRNQAKTGQTSEAISQAESWAKKGLEIVTATRKASPYVCDACEEAYAVLLYNMAIIREFSGDEVEARRLLKESLEHSKAIGLEEGIKHANGALNGLTTSTEGPETAAASS